MLCTVTTGGFLYSVGLFLEWIIRLPWARLLHVQQNVQYTQAIHAVTRQWISTNTHIEKTSHVAAYIHVQCTPLLYLRYADIQSPRSKQSVSTFWLAAGISIFIETCPIHNTQYYCAVHIHSRHTTCTMWVGCFMQGYVLKTCLCRENRRSVADVWLTWGGYFGLK